VAAANYLAPNPSFTVEPQITWRLDQIFNENNRAYVRYTQNITTGHSLRNDPAAASNTLAATTPSGIAIPAGASGISYNPNNVYAAAIGFTHVFSPTFYSETILSQSWIGEHNYAGGTPNADFEQEMRGICGYIGLEWQPSMGEFAQRVQSREHATPSTAQLSQGLVTSATAQWRHYENHLAPVLPALEPWMERFGYR